MFGAAKLMTALSAIGRAPAHGAAADAKKAKRLPAGAKAAYKAMREEQQKRTELLRQQARREIDAFFAEHKLPPRPDYSKERKVVEAFVLNQTASGPNVFSNGTSLLVGGREVASRKSVEDRFMKVCPGEFGADRASRRAANALLNILGADVRIDDRKDTAFLRASGGSGGRVVSDRACYTVEVSRKIRQAAGVKFGPRAPQSPPGFDESLIASAAVDGLGRRGRRGRR